MFLIAAVFKEYRNKIQCKGAKLLNPKLFSRYDSSRIFFLYFPKLGLPRGVLAVLIGVSGVVLTVAQRAHTLEPCKKSVKINLALVSCTPDGHLFHFTCENR